MSRHNWEELFAGKTVHENWTTLRDTILGLQEKYIPKTSFDHMNHKFRVGKDLLVKIKKKHRQWTRYMETRDPRHFNEFCRLRNQIKREVRNVKKHKEKLVANHAKENPKGFWKFIKSKTSNREGVHPLANATDQLVFRDEDKAEVLANQFSSVYTIEPDKNFPAPNSPQREMVEDIVINMATVENKLASLKTNKSSGPDGIHPRVLKEIRGSISNPLSIIFNESLTTGEIPLDWKIATISAIYKKGKKDDAANYRPVSLTSIASEIMESFLRDNIDDFLK